MQSSPVTSSVEAGSTTHPVTIPKHTQHRSSTVQYQLSGLRIEHALYAAIFVAAVLTRFWDLGSRALHHDESLHAYFSWWYAIGNGYIHDPLMHGPFLFHATALMYLLFGMTDAVSRFFPAFLGVVLVMLPWFMRSERLLGRWGALSASTLLLVSPSILYYSRFIRHDIFAATGALLLFIAIVRYVDRPAPRWAIMGGLSTAYLLTTKEVSFIVLFVFATFLGVAIALRVAPFLLAIAGTAGVTFLLTSRVLHMLGAPPLPGIPWDQPTGQQIQHFAIKLITHPVVVAAIGILLLTIVVALWILNYRRPKDTGWIDGILGDAPDGSTAAALRELLLERRGLLIGVAGGAAIFVVLYTSLFTNMGGIASGTFGALGYWLGQQGVQRGQEPWFYYLLLLLQYEFVAVLLFPVAATLLAWRTFRGWRHSLTLDSRTYVRGFLLYWALGMLAVLSWAGEKMPWNDIHIALPMTLLAASYIGDVVGYLERGWARWSQRDRFTSVTLAGSALLLLATAFLALAWASDGPYRVAGGTVTRSLRPAAADHWWLYVYLPWLALIAIVVVGAVKLGWRRSLNLALLAGLVGFTLAQIHAEWRLTYREGDVPKDMLIYVQTAPNVPMVTNQLRQLSQQVDGDMGLSIWYDDVTQWPFSWYMKDFTNRRYIGRDFPPTIDAQVIVVADQTLTPAMEQQLSQNYTYQEYPMRWWFPEENTYRRFAYAPDIKDPGRQNYQDSKRPPFTILDVAGSVWSSVWSLHEPRQQGKIFRMLTYREVPSGLGAVRYRVYVRNDLLPLFDQIRY